MGQQQSKDELLYQQVNYGNVEGIKALARDGARLEWVDREGKTALIQASMNPEHYNVAKTLIDLGANVNAYRPGRNGGTPLHHAAKRGLDSMVKLLLSHGANALVMNDDCQTPLEVARAKGFSNVVRTIEHHICLFSGWMREFHGPGFLEVLAPQLVSRKVWVVVLPAGSRNPSKPMKLELAIYSTVQDAQPRTLIPLWKADLEEPKHHLPDPSATIIENSIPRGRRRRRARRRPQTLRQTRVRLASANEGDKQQFRWFCDACKGIPQAARPPLFLQSSHPPVPPPVQATAPLSAEDVELAMAINASIQSAMSETMYDTHSCHEAGASTSWYTSSAPGGQVAQGMPASGHPKETSSDRAMNQAIPNDDASGKHEIHSTIVPAIQTGSQTLGPGPSASAPPLSDEIVEDGPIHYPTIDSTPIELSSPPAEKVLENTDGKKEDGGSSSCVICLDAPVEGACIPCGHMAGCMSCLSEIKAKKWGCPVCRAKIDQVVRLYAV